MCAQRSTPSRALAPVQSVMMWDFRGGKDIWKAGTIAKRTGPVSYRVQVDPTTQWRIYTDQIVVLGYLSQIAQTLLILTRMTSRWYRILVCQKQQFKRKNLQLQPNPKVFLHRPNLQWKNGIQYALENQISPKDLCMVPLSRPKPKLYGVFGWMSMLYCVQGHNNPLYLVELS